jgi:hypothetical protein
VKITVNIPILPQDFNFYEVPPLTVILAKSKAKAYSLGLPALVTAVLSL